MASVLYYDKDDKHLWVKENGKQFPIYTYSNFSSDSIRLTEDGYLTVYDSYTEQWDRVKDVNGNDVCLKGPQGDPGENGINGENGANGLDANIYHIELSNDMDQVYVGHEQTVETEHYVETTFTLYNGSNQQTLDEEWRIIFPESTQFPWETSISENTIRFTFKQGVYIKDASYFYPITIVKLNSETNQEICRISKEFKLKRIKGTKDYDLKVNQNVIKLLQTGYVNPTNSEIIVNVKSKSIGALDSLIETLIPEDLPINYTVEYKWSTDTTTSAVPSNGVIELPVNTLMSPDNYLTILLRENSAGVLDTINLECIKDGSDGTAIHIELSDDFNQIYFLNKLFVGPNEGVSTTVSLYDGLENIPLNVEDVIVENSTITNYFTVNKSKQGNSVLITLTYKDDVPKPDSVTQFKVPITVNGSQTKNFTITCLEGVSDYDLWISPDFTKVVKPESGTHSYTTPNISVKISKTDLSPTSTSIGQYLTLQDFQTEGLYITCDIDGTIFELDDLIVPIESSSEVYRLNIPLYVDNTIPQKVTISLYNQSKQLIDWSEVAILKDGDKGDPGDKGESAYYLDVTNDFDQIYRANQTLLADQSFSTDLYLYHGSDKMSFQYSENAESIEILDSVIPSDYIRKEFIEDEPEFYHARIIIDFSDVSTLTPILADKKNIQFKFRINQSINGKYFDLYKTLTVAILDSTDDFDIHVSSTQILKDEDNQLKNENINVYIAHRNLTNQGASVEQLTTVDELNELGLVLKYSHDSTAPVEFTSGNLVLDTSLLAQVNNYLNLSLYKDGVLRDTEQIGVSKDGQNGTSAKQLVCTSGSEHVFYLNPLGKGLQQDQSWTPTFAFIDNGESATISENQITLTSDQIQDSISGNTITISNAKNYSENTYSITATYSYGSSTYTCTLHAICMKGSVSYDLKCNPGYIKKSSLGIYSPIEFSVHSECSGGGYHEETTSDLTDGSGLTLWITGVSGDDQMITGSNEGKIIYTPVSDRLTTFKLRNGTQKTGSILDFQILTNVKDGAGFIDTFPENPELGDTYVWGGQTGEDTTGSVGPGYIIQGMTYRFCAIPIEYGIQVSTIDLVWEVYPANTGGQVQGPSIFPTITDTSTEEDCKKYQTILGLMWQFLQQVKLAVDSTSFPTILLSPEVHMKYTVSNEGGVTKAWLCDMDATPVYESAILARLLDEAIGIPKESGEHVLITQINQNKSAGIPIGKMLAMSGHFVESREYKPGDVYVGWWPESQIFDPWRYYAII